jgi:hypothetical protein
MSVGTTPQECLRLLDIEENKFRDYEKRWNDWDKEIEIYRQLRNTTQNEINTKDLALSSYILSLWSGLEWVDNNRGPCAKVPGNYETPQGRKLPLNQNVKDTYNYGFCRKSFDDTYFNTEKAKIVALINKINNEIQPKLNEISSRMPQPVSITLSCCMNQINCKDGRCDGNIQVCRTSYTNLLDANQNSEIEANNLKNITVIDNIISNNLNEINNLSKNIYNEIFKVYSIIDKNNILETLKNLKIIYDNVKIDLDKVDIITKDLKKNKEDAIKYNDTTRNNSIYKNNILQIVQSINNNFNNINNTLKLIRNDYEFIKKIYDSMEKENNDLILLNLNKMNIVSTIKLINDNIDNINALYESATNFNILSNIDLESLLDLLNKSTLYLENININNENLNNFYTTFINIFNKFPKNSDFFYVASGLNDEVKEKILEINNNIINVNKTSRNINDIYILKKEIYEANIIKEEQLLLESSKKKENKNITTNPPIIEYQPTPIVKENNEENNTVLIIIIIVFAVFLITLIYLLYKKWRSSNNNNNNK